LDLSDLSDRAQSTSPATGEPVAGVSSWLLLWVWLSLGVQSFGGGTATLFLMRQAVVERYRWLSEEDFTRSWGVSQIAPGINLLGLTILIGWRLARSRGVVLALFGLLAPSVTITVLMTTLYRRIQEVEAVQAAVNGIIPATVGLSFLLAIRLAQPLLQKSRREGTGSLALSISLLIGSGALVALTRLPVVSLLWGAGVVAGFFYWWHGATQPGSQQND
jgi:chromate transporter